MYEFRNKFRCFSEIVCLGLTVEKTLAYYGIYTLLISKVMIP